MSKLDAWFSDCPRALVAFSGGVDSALVAVLARRFLEDRMEAVISASESLKRSELADGRLFCEEQGIPLRVVRTRELSIPAYAANPENRCYYCKHTLYTELKTLSAQADGAWILNGTNTDDHGDYRPGLQAADEFQVRSPLAEVGMDKAAVREMAKALDLRVWDKPASPCLSSRIPYGQAVTEDKLRAIESGEAVLVEMGFPVCRVRHFGDRAVVEVPAERLVELLAVEPELTRRLREIGFGSVELDREGFVSGKLNRSISHRGAGRRGDRAGINLSLEI